MLFLTRSTCIQSCLCNYLARAAQLDIAAFNILRISHNIVHIDIGRRAHICVIAQLHHDHVLYIYIALCMIDRGHTHQINIMSEKEGLIKQQGASVTYQGAAVVIQPQVGP